MARPSRSLGHADDDVEYLVVVVSVVAGLEYPDAGSDRLRSFLRNCVRSEGSSDSQKIIVVHHRCLDHLNHHLGSSALLSDPVHATLAQSHRGSL